MYTRLNRCAIGLAAVVLFAGTASAQQAAPAFVGAWSYAPEQGSVIERAIDRGTAEMNFVTKPIARRRLRATNTAYATVDVRLADGAITTVLAGRAIASPADGRAVPYTREDGEVMRVATVLREGTLVQTFTAEDGSRENVYSASPDGRRLTLQVTIRSGRLPQPIVYRLAYDRSP